MSENLLADMLYKSSMKNFGSDEHMQIAGLLKDSKKNVIDTQSAIEIRHLLNNDPHAIERGLNFIQRPKSPVWYEWGLETRSGHGGNQHVKTGCLITPHEFDENLMLAVTGWSTDGVDARHAFAVALFDTETMTQVAKIARSRKNSSANASLSRIMSCIEVTMPPGFNDEIDILTGSDPFAKERTYRDATAEIPFLLAIMLLEQSKGGLSGTQTENVTHQALSPSPKKGRIREFFDNVRQRENYISTPKGKGSSPVWYR